MSISIIIPVYNVEKYLDRCIETVVNQELRDVEIILVDDGSTDACGKICDGWAKKDDRIKVIHKRNGGLMSAWKCGVESSNGDYIGFVDSDDWIEPNMFSVLYKYIVADNADMVVCGLVEKNDKNESIGKQYSFVEDGLYCETEIRDKIFEKLFVFDIAGHRGIIPSRVAKLYKREIIEAAMPLCDENVSIGEDLLTTFASLRCVKRLRIINDFFPYNYRLNSQSMIHKYSDSKYEKLDILKESLYAVDREFDHDFHNQIEADYVMLMLLQMEAEMLFSEQNTEAKKASLMLRYKDKIAPIVDNIRDRKIFSFKQRLYLFMLKHKLINTLIFLRNLKKS